VDWRTQLEQLIGTGRRTALTRPRIAAAYTVAIVTDGLQLLLGPFGWAFADEILDVIATIATTALLGFHPLLLPTFILELVPMVDMVPTWTICVALVIAMRRKPPPLKMPDDASPPIDVTPTSVR
jgi:hypothetical protein